MCPPSLPPTLAECPPRSESSSPSSKTRALVDIAHGLGKRTIAEFVEDEATLQLLKELGVDYVQGFHVARPAPIEEPIRTAPDRTAH